MKENTAAELMQYGINPIHKGNLAIALNYFEKAIDINPKSDFLLASLYGSKGTALRGLRNNIEAEKWLKKAIRTISPKNPQYEMFMAEGWMNIGWIQFELNHCLEFYNEYDYESP